MATTTKARKGDLVLVEIVLHRDFTKKTTEYQFGVVASTTREGLVKTWAAVGWGDELVSDSGQPIGLQRRLVASQKDIDVTGVIKAAKAHHWPGHPDQPKAFDSLSEAQAIAKPFQLGAPSSARGVASALVDDWQAARRELREIEEAEHPDITDALGRVWKWKDKDLYTHDGMAWPRELVERPSVSLPSQAALDNPNYRWCSICKGDGA